ncbi:hypothetical protein D3C86_1831830 [compost metagenome]
MLDEDAWRNDGLGVQLSQLAEALNGGNGVFRRHGHHRAEVACRLSVHQVSPAVASLGLDQGVIDVNGILEYVIATLNGAGLFTFGQQRAKAGRGKKRADTHAGSAQAFCQIALRHYLQFDVSRPV